MLFTSGGGSESTSGAEEPTVCLSCVAVELGFDSEVLLGAGRLDAVSVPCLRMSVDALITASNSCNVGNRVHA